MAELKAEDATTNPSLIIQAANKPEYKDLIDEAIKYGKENYNKKPKASRPQRSKSKSKQKIETEEEEEKKIEDFKFENLTENDKKYFLNLAVDRVVCNFGKKILDIVPGVVSSEVDARLSFDMQATVNRAKRII